MTKKIFLGFSFFYSIVAFLSLIANNIFAKGLNIGASVLFVIPGSICLGSILFFASRLFLKKKYEKLFNKIVLWQVGIFTALSVAAPFVSMSSVALSWSWLIGICQVAAQVMFFVHCTYLNSKKKPKKHILILSLAFVALVLAIVTVNYILNIDPEISATGRILEIVSNILKNAQFLVLGAYVIYEKA